MDGTLLVKYEARKKSVTVAYLLWFFLGSIGAHRLYLRSWFGWLFVTIFSGVSICLLSAILLGSIMIGSGRLFLCVAIGGITTWLCLILAEVSYISRRVEELNTALVFDLETTCRPPAPTIQPTPPMLAPPVVPAATAEVAPVALPALDVPAATPPPRDLLGTVTGVVFVVMMLTVIGYFVGKAVVETKASTAQALQADSASADATNGEDATTPPVAAATPQTTVAKPKPPEKHRKPAAVETSDDAAEPAPLEGGRVWPKGHKPSHEVDQ